MITTAGMKLHKMHTNGNDFLILDASQQRIPDTNAIKQLANRRYGIGCDQLIAITQIANQSVHCLFFNQDGSSAALCLNGIYAVATFVLQSSDSTTCTLSTQACTFHAQTTTANQPITISFPDSICQSLNPVHHQATEQLGNSISQYIINVGNLHYIIETPQAASFPLDTLAASPEIQKAYPDGINISVFNHRAEGTLSMRTFERGAGLTQGCGSAALALFLRHRLSAKQTATLHIHQPGGQVQLWQQASRIHMQASCHYIAQINT